MLTRCPLWIALLIASLIGGDLVGVAAAGATALRAEQITRSSAPELIIGGPEAIGGVGDWYLANDVIEIIVDDPARRHGKLNHGGTLIDAGRLDRKDEDQFSRLFPLLNLDQRVFAQYDTIQAEIDPNGRWARLLVSSSAGLGSLPRGGWLARWLNPMVPDPEDLRQVFIETEYRVLPGEPFVHLRTTIRNEGERAAPIFAYSDVVMRGARALRAFTGHTLRPEASRGFHHISFDRSHIMRASDALAPFTFLSMPGVPGYPPIGYTLFAPEITKAGRVPFFGVTDDQVSVLSTFLFENDWEKFGLLRMLRAMLHKLPAGASWTHRRRLLITGRSDVASATDIIFPLLGYSDGDTGVTGIVEPRQIPHMIHVSDAESHSPVTAMASYTHGQQAGGYHIGLPPGNYLLSIRAPQRLTETRQIEVPTKGYTDALSSPFSEPAYLLFDTDTTGGSPTRIIVTVLDGTPDPRFEPDLLDFRIDGKRVDSAAETHTLSFVGDSSDPRRVAIPPGLYQLTATRGLEYDLAQTTVRLEGAGHGVRVPPLRPRRVIELPEYLIADLHVHAQASDDTNLSNLQRLRSSIAEGVEVLIATDHDHISLYAPQLEQLESRDRIRVIPGVEVTSSAPSPEAPWTIGHTNAWPMRHDPLAHRRGAPPSQRLALADLYTVLRESFGAELVQMNHPRQGGVGVQGGLETLGPEGRPYDPEKPITQAPNRWLLEPGADGRTRAIDFDAIELMNGPSIRDYQRVRKDLYSFLRQGFRRTGTAVSDLHGARGPSLPQSYVHFPAGLSGFDAHAFARAVREGRLMCTTGPLFTRFRVNGGRMGDLVAAPGGRVHLELTVAAAPWVPVEEVRVLINGETVRVFHDLPPVGAPESLRLAKEMDLTLEHDALITLEAGAPLLEDPEEPVPPSPGLYSEVVAPGFVSMAFANPIYVDVDGNGRFDAPGL